MPTRARFKPSELKVDAGVEANIGLSLVYYLETQIKIGYARAFSAPEGNQWYFLAAASF